MRGIILLTAITCCLCIPLKCSMALRFVGWLSSDIARAIRRRIRWAALDACMTEMRNSYGISVGNLEVKVFFWDVSCEDNIKMDLHRL
jgi:hypothetical protein